MATLKYNEKFPAIAEDLAANGESDEYIAFRLQISMPTFYNYKAQFPEFAEALVVGRKVCYSRVRAKLLKLAHGRCIVITEVYKDGELHKTIERQLPPNLKAIVYFQKHMRVGGRLSGEFCLRQDGQRPVENAQPQDDSKMSNGESMGERVDESMGQQPIESAQPQTYSKMSNGEESQTEQTCPTRPTCPTSPATAPVESTQPQADSKMSNGRLSGVSCPPPVGAGSPGSE